jgi:hypothetical protein
VLGIFDFLIFLFSRGMISPRAAAALGIAGALIERRAARHYTARSIMLDLSGG